MSDKTIYLKMNAKIKTTSEKICMGDLGKIYCKEANVLSKLKTIPVYHFKEADHNRCVIGVLKVIEIIHENYPTFSVDVIGETECVIDKIKEKKTPPIWEAIKIAFISAICFFGTMYTIMAYHNEINLVDMFQDFYAMVTGMPNDGFTPLEASYSIGLSVGIIIFYNHIGKRKLTPDPSPVSVEMRTYEDDVNRSIVELANREEKTIDVK